MGEAGLRWSARPCRGFGTSSKRGNTVDGNTPAYMSYTTRISRDLVYQVMLDCCYQSFAMLLLSAQVGSCGFLDRLELIVSGVALVSWEG